MIATDPTNAMDTRDSTKGITVIVDVTNDPDENPSAPMGEKEIVLDENEEMDQEVYTVTNPDNLPFTWALTGADAEDFEISQLNGGLSLKEAPNYEDPDDSDTNNTYTVNVGIVLTGRTTPETIPDASRQTEVTVTVRDVAEAPEFTQNKDDKRHGHSDQVEH